VRKLTCFRVALDVGFGDLSNFVRTFRHVGCVTPGQFRAASHAAARMSARIGR